MTKKSETSRFVTLMAFLMSFVALSIDAMMPALGQMGNDLMVTQVNDIQLVISSIFLGMAIGLMLYGPLSDTYGRKFSLYVGMGFFILGTLISLWADDLNTMLAGRVLQGFGAAACRVVTLAMIRDKFEGPEMARIMSFIMIIFILVPALAPSLGQLILMVSHWHGIFWMFLIFSIIGLVWLRFGQEETLLESKRLPFSVSAILSGTRETLRNPISLGYTLASGLIFGAFVGYLSSAQPILQDQYGLGSLFSIVFGSLALVIGISSYANSKLVMKFPMEMLCYWSLAITCAAAGAFLILPWENPPLLALLVFLSITFFSFGILFGNFNTLAVQPLGHIAGIANSVISSIQTFISVLIGGFIGHLYDGTVVPLALGFLVCSSVSLGITFFTIKKGGIK